jgi:hypothetical protein
MKNKLASFFVIATLLLGMLAFAVPVNASPSTVLKVVDPTDGDNIFHFWSDVNSPGDTFKVSIIVENVPDPGFYGWEFYLSWTPSVINCTLEELNTNIWSPYSKWVPSPIDNAAGKYHQSVTGQAPALPQTGTWWLVNLTFKIVAPAPYMSVVSTGLTLSPPAGATYCIADISGTEIPHDFINGNYYYHWAPPLVLPYLSVVPQSTVITGKNIFKNPVTFTIDIDINDVNAGWRLAGTEFLLCYNTTVLDVLNVEVGDFFEPFFSPIAPPQTFKYSAIFEDEGKIRVAYTMMDIPNMIPPYGEGKIARITFNATWQEKFPTSVYSDFLLEVDTGAGCTSYFANYLGEELSYAPAVNGTYELKGYVIGKVIDVYTQYPEPYGGQGPEAPSDMFWPQKQVDLYAKVTYNEWPAQQKPVAFEVKNNFGTIMTILTGITNETGIAHVSFRMDWPCVDPEQYFGVWAVTATVDIACEVVNDTLQFHYDYLVHWVKVTTDKTDYEHCENVHFNVTFESYARQDYWVYIAGTIHDELNYPVITGTVASYIKIGGAQWCHYKNYTLSFTVHVDKSVVAGEATIHVSALTNPPYAGGCALCPEITKKTNILSK